MTRGERIVEEVTSWPGITTDFGEFGETEFLLDGRALGHVHGSHMADIPFPRRIRDRLVAEGRTGPHHVHPDSGWTTKYMRDDADADEVIALLRVNYDRITERRERSAEHANTRHRLALTVTPRPVLFVLEEDATALAVLLADLERRSGNDSPCRESRLARPGRTHSKHWCLTAFGRAPARRGPCIRVPHTRSRAASAGEARAPRRSRLLVVELGGAGDGAGSRRLPHRPTLGRRRDDVRRDERVPGGVDGRADAPVRAVPSRRQRRRSASLPVARRDVALQHAVRPLFGREHGREAAARGGGVGQHAPSTRSSRTTGRSWSTRACPSSRTQSM